MITALVGEAIGPLNGLRPEWVFAIAERLR